MKFWQSNSRLTNSIRNSCASIAAGINNLFSQPNTKELVIPILSLLVALAGIISSSVIQIASWRAQSEIKQYEVTFIAKQKAYTSFMRSAHNLFNISGDDRSRGDLKEAIDSLQVDVYALQPFLDAKESSALWEDSQKLIELSISSYQNRKAIDNKKRDEIIDGFLRLRDRIRDNLKKSLFPSGTY